MPSSKADPVVSAMLISGKNGDEQTIPCFDGTPPTEHVPEWAVSPGLEFIVEGYNRCDELVDRTVEGKTKFPCCDVPPLPGEPLPGTCVVEKRQLKVYHVQ